MANLARLAAGIALLPACWGAGRALVLCVAAAAGAPGALGAESLALLGGIAAFALSWAVLPRPARAYVLGHELTHALWSLAFGGLPSSLKVGAEGGSVKLTKTNMLITLAPYFFPFYTFVVIVAALVTYVFMRPLPLLPLWIFAIGFTWSFHVLFTLQTLTERQPDVRLYGRIFSWTFIFLANAAIVLVWLASTTSLSFAGMAAEAGGCVIDAYRWAVFTVPAAIARKVSATP